MVELVFVIVILGIVAAIGSGIIAKIYESYIYSKSINTLQTKTELALTQIARFLTYRVKDSVIARKLPPNDTNIVSLPMGDGTYKILEWVGYDNEGFEGNASGPGWSGFVDLASANTDKTQIDTPGSQLDYEKDILSTLSNGDVNLTDVNSSAAIIFTGLPNQFDIVKYGWNDYNGTVDHDYVLRVRALPGTNILRFVENNSSTVYEHYQLVWSAYAIVPEGAANDQNLSFYYNYRPWMGDKYSDGNKSTLMEHVSTFKFRQIGTAIRLKLCVFNPIGQDFNMTFCKEKVVF
jgi:Tfp pilus assembly protein FimT